MTMTAKDFFKANPAAKGCWQIGEQFFLESHERHARDHARQTGGKVEWVANGASTKKPDAKEPQTETSEAAPAATGKAKK